MSDTTTDYYYTKIIDLSPDEAEARVREELEEEGFGVLTEIDVQATLKEKLDEDMRPYKILGACNPPVQTGEFLYTCSGTSFTGR